MDYLIVCLRVLLDGEESEQANERYFPSIHKCFMPPNLFNASKKNAEIKELILVQRIDTLGSNA